MTGATIGSYCPLHERLQAARESNNTKYYWQEFAPQIRPEIIDLQAKLMQIESVAARVTIVSPLDAVRRMAYEDPFPMSEEYIEASTDYMESIKDLEQFVAEAKSSLKSDH